jgi:hypothetical protein
MSVGSFLCAPVIAVAILGVNGCAYHQYMEEERGRTVTLNKELDDERAAREKLELRSQELEAQKVELRGEIAVLKQKLRKDQDALARLNQSRPAAPTRTQSSETNRLKREIDATQMRIKGKQDELDALTSG